MRAYWLWAILLPLIELFGQIAPVLPLSSALLRWLAIILNSLTIFIVPLFLVAIPAALIFAAIAAFSRLRRRPMLSGAAACVCFAGFYLAAMYAGTSFRSKRFLETGPRGEPIVAALAAYKQATGAYPDSLDAIVPSYIPAIPSIGLLGYLTFDYRKATSDNRLAEGTYELYINCGQGIMGFDRFIYWPTEDYPDNLNGNSLERIGRWAYMHE